MTSPSITQLLNAGWSGDAPALRLVHDLLFGQLRQTAQHLLRRERFCVTLQPTALVSEFFLRFHRFQCHILSREHFLFLARRSMKQFLIDRGRVKSIRHRHHIELKAQASHSLLTPLPLQVMVKQAIDRLAALDPRTAETVWLIKVEGLTAAEVATLQHRARWRVTEDCDFALDWLAKELR